MRLSEYPISLGLDELAKWLVFLTQTKAIRGMIKVLPVAYVEVVSVDQVAYTLLFHVCI
jgi:hypothetical protein